MLPKQMIWPILPGVSSLRNYRYGVSSRFQSKCYSVTRYLCRNVLKSCQRGSVLGWDGPTVARSGMKRSPITRTSLDAILCHLENNVTSQSPAHLSGQRNGHRTASSDASARLGSRHAAQSSGCLSKAWHVWADPVFLSTPALVFFLTVASSS